MSEFKSRIHRLELPSMPKTDDPAALKRALDQMRRLVQDEFNRLSTDFYDFKKTTFEAGVIPLRQVNDLVVTYDEYSMTATWENPQQEDAEPTHVRVRILEITPNNWAEYSYPKDAWQFNGLVAGTQYTMQVQLIGRYEASETFVSTTRNCPSVPVLRIAESAIKSKVFTTLTGVAPPTDAGGTDTEIIFTYPTPPDTGGTVGSGGCWWEYGFQQETLIDLPGGLTPIFTDIGSLTEFSGLVSSVTIDTSAAPFDTAGDGPFRLKYRSVCDSVEGDWIYTPPFMKADLDGAHLCGAFTASASAAEAPYTTADLFAIPTPCHPIGGWFKIQDGVSGNEVTTHGPAYAGTARVSDEWTVFGADTSGLATGYGQLLTALIPNIALLHDESDFTFSIDLWMNEAYNAGNNELPGGQAIAYNVMVLGNKVKLAAIFGASTWSAQITVPRAGGGSYIFRADGLGYAEWQEIFYRHDVSQADGRQLYVQGVLKDQSASAWLNDFDDIDNTYKIYGFPFMRMRKNYGWGSIAAAPTPSTLTTLGTAIIGLNPSVYFDMSEPTTAWSDLSSNGNDGVANGTPNLTNPGIDGKSYLTGDNTDDGGVVPYDAAFTVVGSPGISMHALLKWPTGEGTNYLIARLGSGTALQWIIWGSNSSGFGNITIDRYDSAGTINAQWSVDAATGDGVLDGAWHQVVLNVANDATSPEIWIDNVAQPIQVNLSGTDIEASPGSLEVAGYVSSLFRLPTNALLAHFALFDGHLTGTNVGSLETAAIDQGFLPA